MDDSGAGHPGPSVHPHRLAHGRRLNGQQTDADSFHAKSDVNEQRDRVRRRMSDSETLSDDILIESNDEGIETDHIDEKIEDGVIKSAKELEIYIGKELVDNGKDILLEEPIIMSQLQLPSIVIQGEGTEKGISPVSSRSESPIRYSIRTVFLSIYPFKCHHFLFICQSMRQNEKIKKQCKIIQWASQQHVTLFAAFLQSQRAAASIHRLRWPVRFPVVRWQGEKCTATALQEIEREKTWSQII